MYLRFELDPDLDEELSDRLLTIWTDVSNAGGSVGFVPPVTEDEVRPVAEQAFKKVRSGEHRILVGYRRNEPVGFLFLEQRPGPLFKHFATVKRLQVHPSFQRRGIGGALLGAAEDAARGLGLEQLHLTVRGGTGTESFYEARGYELKARIPGLIKVARGEYRDELYLMLRL
jgi:GNAT superfamily N-acetyltransferase